MKHIEGTHLFARTFNRWVGRVNGDRLSYWNHMGAKCHLPRRIIKWSGWG